MIKTYSDNDMFYLEINDVIIISKPEDKDISALTLYGDANAHKINLKFKNVSFFGTHYKYENMSSINKYRVGLFITTVLSIFLLLKGL